MHVRVGLGLLVLGVGLGLVVVLPTTAAEKVSPEAIAKLVEKLGSPEFAERDKANKELEALREQAVHALKKAVKGEDLETKRRAEELLTKAEPKLLAKHT